MHDIRARPLVSDGTVANAHDKGEQNRHRVPMSVSPKETDLEEPGKNHQAQHFHCGSNHNFHVSRPGPQITQLSQVASPTTRGTPPPDDQVGPHTHPDPATKRSAPAQPAGRRGQGGGGAERRPKKARREGERRAEKGRGEKTRRGEGPRRGEARREGARREESSQTRGATSPTQCKTSPSSKAEAGAGSGGGASRLGVWGLGPQCNAKEPCQRSPLTRLSHSVAGTGFEPATSGL